MLAQRQELLDPDAERPAQRSLLAGIVGQEPHVEAGDRGPQARGELPGRADPLYLQATTACLSTIVVMQVANVFVCRHPQESALRFSLTENPLLLLGLAVELGLPLLSKFRAQYERATGTDAAPPPAQSVPAA